MLPSFVVIDDFKNYIEHQADPRMLLYRTGVNQLIFKVFKLQLLLSNLRQENFYLRMIVMNFCKFLIVTIHSVANVLMQY